MLGVPDLSQLFRPQLAAAIDEIIRNLSRCSLKAHSLSRINQCPHSIMFLSLLPPLHTCQ